MQSQGEKSREGIGIIGYVLRNMHRMEAMMARTVGIGIQSFERVVTNHYFYVDKTNFIKEWWESGDDVTLITRPRRFGKTLNMNMVERFFSVKYKEQGQIFENLSIWKEDRYRFAC